MPQGYSSGCDSCLSFCAVISGFQPSIVGMEPPFGDAFQNYTFADQALTSTDLLANSSDPDFMYELDRDTTQRQSPQGEGGGGSFAVEAWKEVEGCMDMLIGIGESDTATHNSSNFEQWDSYWEDLTRYTRLASCDIWGTKEVDFLGLDDFSSPYQDEEVIGQTPTLAQLNSGDDSQSVCEGLYHPPSLPSLPPSSSKKGPGLGAGLGKARPAPGPYSFSLAGRSPLPDFPEDTQKAMWPAPSSTETMSKTHSLSLESSPAKGPGARLGPDFVRKAKVRVGALQRPPAEPRLLPDAGALAPPPRPTHSVPFARERQASASNPAVAPTGVAAFGSGSAAGFERRPEAAERRGMPAAACVGRSGAALPLDGARESLGGGGAAPETDGSPPGAAVTLGAEAAAAADDDKTKEEEHNYSLFLTRARLAGRSLSELEEEEEEDEEEEMEEEGLDVDDEDHDEGFGSEHELSENEEEEEEEEEEDEDYEADKDDDMSDTFSEQGCDMEQTEDVKGLTAGVSRKRGKRRYFWEYSEQLTPSKQERMLKPSEWDRYTLPSNLYQKNGPHHGKYMLKKSRRTDVEDLTPNPRKLLQIGTELRKLNKVISDLTPVSELPLTARPRSRKEKNKLASRACRLKKKAQYEANKVKLWGLSTEYDRLLFVINAIKEEIVAKVEDASPQPRTMATTMDRLIQEANVASPVAGQTSDFVNQILETTGQGDPTGGLVGLRVPTSKS